MKNSESMKKSHFPKGIFGIVLGILLLSAGLQMGIIVLWKVTEWSTIVEVHVLLLYWFLTALVITLFLRKKMEKYYDLPMQNISKATKQVATGDFSVRIDTLHKAGKEDYLDIMIHDLNAMFAELGSIETLKTDFISNISHEIRTPISVVQNYARLLQSENLTDEEKIEYSKVILDASSRLNTMITNILKLNRLENQSIGLKNEAFDLSAQLTECLLGFETIWEEKQIEILPEIEDGIIVESDSELLSIVWNNLLSNAFKFTEPGGKVGISLKKAEDAVSVSVSDTGCGMSDEVVRHIYDKFYQGDTSHAVQGNGLGLALVKQITDMVGAAIHVETAVEKGSTITINL